MDGDKGGEVKSFKDLIVWQKSHQLFLEIAKDIESFPKNRVVGDVHKNIS